MDPSTYTNAIAWLSPDTSNLWVGSVGGTNVANVDDTIQNAEMDIASQVFSQATSGNRPQYKGSGWIYFGLVTANRYLQHVSSGSYYNNFHVDGTGGLLIAFQRNSVSSTQEFYITNHLDSTGRQGFKFDINSANSGRVAVCAGGTDIATVTFGAVSDTNTHILEVRWIDGLLWVRFDNQAPVTAAQSGSLGTGAASSDVRIGVRSNATLPANGKVRDLVVLSRPAAQADRLDWRTRNPYQQANSSNDVAEIRIGSRLEATLRQAYSWTLDALRLDGYPICAGLSGVYGGTILNINSTWYGSGHGGETITSKQITLGGATETLGAGLYVDDALATIDRQSTLGTTFYLRSTKVLKETGFTETVRLERISPSDGLSISSSAYPYLNSLGIGMDNYVWYGADGSTLDSGTFSSKTIDAEIKVSGGVALLAYDTTNNKGVLHILKDPGTLTNDIYAIHRATDNKFYGRMIGLDGSAGGEVFTTRWQIVLIEATSGTYEAAGAAAVAKAFAPAIGRSAPGIGFGFRV